jgi:hypothetical protein
VTDFFGFAEVGYGVINGVVEFEAEPGHKFLSVEFVNAFGDAARTETAPSIRLGREEAGQFFGQLLWFFRPALPHCEQRPPFFAETRPILRVSQLVSSSLVPPE